MSARLLKIFFAFLVGCTNVAYETNNFDSNILAVDEFLNTANSSYLDGNHLAAESLAKKVLNLDPCNHIALDILGLVNFELGDFEDSLEFFTASVRCNPAYSRGYFHLAATLSMLGKQEEAWSEFNRAVNLNPLDEEVSDVWVILESNELDKSGQRATVFLEVNK